MNKKERIEKEIQKTLAQFESKEQLTPNPYFFTRVQARLSEKKQKQSYFAAILKPALLTILVGINLGTAIWYLGNNQQQTNQRQELVEFLADDFRLDTNSNSIFNLE